MLFFLLVSQDSDNRHGKKNKFVINSSWNTFEEASAHRRKLNSLYGERKSPFMIVKKGYKTPKGFSIAGMKFDEDGVEL